jgi:hypothetical protein
MSKARLNGKIEVKISPVCNKCRERHVKCDGGPQCSRCKHEGAVCQFRPSRRGMRPSSQHRLIPSSDDGSPDVVSPARSWMPSELPMLALTDNLSPLHRIASAEQSQSSSPSRLPIPMDVSTYLTDLFYTNFYPGHPFVLPREHFIKELAAVEQCPLKPVIEYVGTFYDATFDKAEYQNRAEKLLSTHRYPSDGPLVQALLVFAIGLSADGHSTKADIFLRKANKCAMAIGMDDPAYFCLGPGGRIVLGESWRRTWLVLRELCPSRQSSSSPRSTTHALSPWTTVESSAGLDAPVQYESSSSLAPSMAWKGFGDSQFATGQPVHSQYNFSTMCDSRRREDDKTCALNDLLAEAALYDCIQLHDSARHSIEWGHHQEGQGIAQYNRPSLPENDFTRMLFEDLSCL